MDAEWTQNHSQCLASYMWNLKSNHVSTSTQMFQYNQDNHQSHHFQPVATIVEYDYHKLVVFIKDLKMNLKSLP